MVVWADEVIFGQHLYKEALPTDEITHHNRERQLAVAQNTMALASQALHDAQLDLWQTTFAYVKSMALKSAIDLGIAETIQHHGGGATLSQIATRAMVPPAKIPCLSRLMRVLTATGVFNAQKTPSGISSCEQLFYSLTPMSRLLVGSRNQVPITTLILQSTVVSSLFELGGWLRRELPEPCMFQLRNDHTLWELADSDPAFNALFNNGMNSDTELIMDIVVNEFGEVFHGVDSLIDVAGGHGAAAHAIMKAFPHLKCSVLDLGHVVADAPNDTNVHYIAGNMFETVPPASMIFLKVCGRLACCLIIYLEYVLIQALFFKHQ